MTVQKRLGHYTIPLKRDMKPTGVGRNLQICSDPGLCSRAVNMIYSKPFPDGAIKTRGSGFGSVSWSRWGAGREQRRQRSPGTWQGLHVPMGTPCWGRPNSEPCRCSRSEQGSCSCPGDALVVSVLWGCSGPLCVPGMLSISAAPVTGSMGCVVCGITLESKAPLGCVWPGLAVGARVSGDERLVLCGMKLFPVAAVPVGAGDTWVARGGQVAEVSATLLVPHPGSHLGFSHTLSLLLYLSLIIRPTLRNPGLPLWQLLLIYPPHPRNARWHRSQRMGRAGDKGCPWP